MPLTDFLLTVVRTFDRRLPSRAGRGGFSCAHRGRPRRDRSARNSLKLAALLAAVWFSSTSLARGQQNASVSGTVTDSSGAAVAGATVSVTNVNTGVTVTAITNSTGYYVAGNLIPGQYTLTAEMKGFEKVLRSQFTLEVAQVATIDLTLQLGAVTQTIEVTGAAPMLQAKTAEVGQVIQGQEVTELPLVDRNYLGLAMLAPGTASYYNRGLLSGPLTDYIGSVIDQGESDDRNAFSLDGADVKAYSFNPSFVPSIDVLQEFKIETSPYSTDLGTSPGAQIIMTTKSGTNSFHGTAWEYFRNNVTDARNFFATSVPELRKNQFGSTVGGPIKKDRIFFFFGL